MKYSYHSHAHTLKGPHTSVCSNSRHSNALCSLDLKGRLIILPLMQDSHNGNASRTNVSNGLELNNHGILLKII